MPNSITAESPLAQQTDEQLCEQLRTGALSERGADHATDLLLERGWAPADIPLHAAAPDLRNFGQKLWTFIADCAWGKAPLLHAMWVLGGVIMATYFVLLVALEMSRLSMVGSLVSVLWVAFSCASHSFHAFCVWRCARNARVHALGQLARIYAGAVMGIWAIGIVMSIVMMVMGWLEPVPHG